MVTLVNGSTYLMGAITPRGDPGSPDFRDDAVLRQMERDGQLLHQRSARSGIAGWACCRAGLTAAVPESAAGMPLHHPMNSSTLNSIGRESLDLKAQEEGNRQLKKLGLQEWQSSWIPSEPMGAREIGQPLRGWAAGFDFPGVAPRLFMDNRSAVDPLRSCMEPGFRA